MIKHLSRVLRQPFNARYAFRRLAGYHAKEGLHDRRERTERKAHGAQRPRHNNELGEGASTAQRSDPYAQQVVQTFPKPRSLEEVVN